MGLTDMGRLKLAPPHVRRRRFGGELGERVLQPSERCSFEPRRRIESVRSAASFLPTAISTGTFASECSRTL